MPALRGKSFILIVLSAIIIFGLLVTLYALRQKQENRSRATAATILSLSPTSSSSGPVQKTLNAPVTFDVMVTPGTNAVSQIQIEINYDASKLGKVTGTPVFQPNITAFPAILEGPNEATGKVTVSVSIGSDVTKVITTPTKVGTLTLQTLATTSTPSQISFGPLTSVVSLASGDNSNENVLSGTSPGYVSIVSALSPTPSPASTGIPTPIFPTSQSKFNLKAIAYLDSNNNCVIDGNSPTVTGVHFTLSGASTAACTTGTDGSCTVNVVGGQYTQTLTPMPTGYEISSCDTVDRSFILTIDRTNHYFLHPLPASNIDLVVTGVQWTPANLRVGDPVTFTATIKNQGTTATPIGKIHKVSFSVDGVVKNWSDTYTTAIPAGGSVTLTANTGTAGTATWAATSGAHVIRATVDDANLITESNESNNFLDANMLTVYPAFTPTPTTVPSTKLNLSVVLHGIGAGGDNANPGNSSSSNKNPLHPMRQVSVLVYDSSNTLVKNVLASVTFNSSSGVFTGVADLGLGLSSGPYAVKLKSDQFLRRLLPIVVMTAGTTTSLPQVTLVTGDANNDNVLNILDYNLLVGCFSEFSPAKSCTPEQKSATDFNDDGAVNSADYNLFIRELAVQSGD